MRSDKGILSIIYVISAVLLFTATTHPARANVSDDYNAKIKSLSLEQKNYDVLIDATRAPQAANYLNTDHFKEIFVDHYNKNIVIKNIIAKIIGCSDFHEEQLHLGCDKFKFGDPSHELALPRDDNTVLFSMMRTGWDHAIAVYRAFLTAKSVGTGMVTHPALVADFCVSVDADVKNSSSEPTNFKVTVSLIGVGDIDNHAILPVIDVRE